MKKVIVKVIASAEVELEDDYCAYDINEYVEDSYMDLIYPPSDFKLIGCEIKEVQKMKTKEFIKRVKELGYDIEISEENVFIKRDGFIIARISRISMYIMRIYTCFKVKHTKELFDLCTEYASTPIEEREEEKKFYLQKMKSFYDNEEIIFLNFDTEQNIYFISSKSQYKMFKTQFTQKEIDKIKEEQHTDLSEFKQIPVEEVTE